MGRADRVRLLPSALLGRWSNCARISLPFPRRSPMPATSLAASDVQQLIDTRRDFHAHPELAFEETRTSSIVAERLRELGLKPATGVGRTGVVATIEGGRPGKTVLLR